MSMIPNPKKNIVIDKSVSEINAALEKLQPYFQNKYSLKNKNEVLKQFTFEATELLSAGVNIDINLNFVSESKTNVIIEVKRKIGAFDQTYEVSNANKHIENIFNGISELLMNPDKEIKHEKKERCYIATAVYGSYDAPEVIVLREFRNAYMQPYLLGRYFIQMYYFISPKIAAHIPKISIVNKIFRYILDFLIQLLR